ncbi:MAG TPA: FAD-dependent oxidoreductase [Burkholderiales bacterium]|jgi:2-polyprenyl-6-methoxyphenol hydroxylase-like FAD-dependent oxidoreductase|nr:FAD-dependent oxidoreductase [Burkholderiales bacterium]
MGSLAPDEKFFQSEIFRGAQRARAPAADLGTWREAAREIPVHARCDVLVTGGGPSGTAAAVAAARLGADVILLERYNHLGGLSTGGLVIWIDRMTDWDGRSVIRGFAEEIFARLPKDAVAGPPREDWGSRDPQRAAYWAQRTSAFHGVVTWAPTIDPERLKLLSQQMVLERKVRLAYHCWAAQPIVESGAVRGVVFESKAGRRAIFAQVTVDATGDGDLFARAGAACESDIEESDIHHCMNTAWLFGGVDMPRWLEWKTAQPQQFAEFMQRGRAQLRFFDKPFVSWRDDIALFLGPRQAGYSALDVADLTEVEVRSHELMAAHLAFYRHEAPGFAAAYALQSAPQLGVRHSRRLVGVGKVLRAQWPAGEPLADEIGVSPSLAPKFPSISIPYGSLVPRELDGLLACGRHISCDPNSHSFLREIPQCWVTGQAAGTAAALAVARGLPPRRLEVAELQETLKNQGVYLRQRTRATQSA